jgi:hypothetical protein
VKQGVECLARDRPDETTIRKEVTDAVERRDELLRLVKQVNIAKDKRDRVMHGTWVGGMQSGTWASEDYPTSDAQISSIRFDLHQTTQR